MQFLNNLVLLNFVRKLCLLSAVAGLLASTLAEAQPVKRPPPTKPTSRMGFLLQIYDPGKLLTTDPLVNLVGSRGTKRTVKPKDNGSRLSADVAAGDRVYSAPVPGFPDPAVNVIIKSGTQMWTIKVTLPTKVRALVLLKLGKNGNVAQSSQLPGKPPAKKVRPNNPGGFLLQLQDPGKLLKAPPVVTLKNMLGTQRTVRPLDNGKDPDVTAKDRIYSSPAPILPGRVMNATVRSGQLSWSTVIKLAAKEDRPLVMMILKPNGKVKLGSRADVAPPVAREVVHPSAPSEPGAPGVKPTKGRPGFLLQIYDPKSYLKVAPKVTLKGSLGTGRVIVPQDSGKIQHSDVIKGDRVFSAPAPFFPDGMVNIAIKSQRRKWAIKVRMNPEVAQALVFLQLFKNGKIKEVPRDSVGKPLPPGHVGLGGGRNLGAVREVIPTVTRPTRPKSQGGSANLGSGFVLWALAFVTLGLGVAITWALTGRKPRGASRLAAPGKQPIAPVQLTADQVAAVLQGPLADHRVVLLGEAPDGGGDVVRCLEEHPLPEELVTAVEQLAVSPGPPVALLVTDPELLDRAGPTDPAISLSKRVARRFPLYVVDGPEQWEGWNSERGTRNAELGTRNAELGTRNAEQVSEQESEPEDRP